MTNDEIALNDGAGQAVAGWHIGADLCRDCGSYHRLWGLLREGGVIGGIDVDRAALLPIIHETLTPGDRVLVAGAADAALLRLVVEATEVRPLAVTVVDRCPAPLALIDRLAETPDVTVTTRQAGLETYSDTGGYALILSHSMLAFVEPDVRVKVLSNLRALLARDGQLLLIARTAPPVLGISRAERDAAWLSRAYEKLRCSRELVDPADPAFAAALRDYAAQRRTRPDGIHTVDDVLTPIREAGLQIVRHQISGTSTVVTYRGKEHAKQSYIVVAAAL